MHSATVKMQTSFVPTM